MRTRPNYYRLLKVQPDAPTEIIRASYRTLMRELKFHPDLGGSNETATLLNEAYDVLSNRDRREEYDRQLLSRGRRQDSPAPSMGRLAERTFACPFCRQRLGRRPLPGDGCPNCESPVRSREIADLEDASRRSVARIRREDRILYYTAWPRKGCEGRLVDLSPRGLRFTCGEMIRHGCVLKISAASFEALATVTNVRPGAESKVRMYSIGASFVAVNFEGPKGTFLSAQA